RRRRVPGTGGVGVDGAGADADGGGRDRRPGDRAVAGRRRLPAQAVRVRRAVGPGAGARPARPARPAAGAAPCRDHARPGPAGGVPERAVRAAVEQGVRRAGRAAARRGRRGLVRAAAGEGVGREHGPVHRRGPADRAQAAAQARRPAGGADRARRGLPHPMRLSLRLRLTVVYGALFMLAGVVLVGVTYLLFDRELVRMFEEKYGAPGGNRHRFLSIVRDGVLLSPEESRRLLAEQEGALRTAATTSLLAQGVIAVLLVACLATALGWVLAGRMLAPLHKVTAGHAPPLRVRRRQAARREPAADQRPARAAHLRAAAARAGRARGDRPLAGGPRRHRGARGRPDRPGGRAGEDPGVRGSLPGAHDRGRAAPGTAGDEPGR